jgi:hypothetical protein
MKTKIEILASARMLIKDGVEWVTVNSAEKAMQSFSDQENARLTAINAKQRELITYLEKKMQWWSMTDDYRWLCNELASLQSVKEADNCIHFDECQGRNHCLNTEMYSSKCIGVDCGHFDDSSPRPEVKCSKCHGIGKIHDRTHGWDTCDKCNGKG